MDGIVKRIENLPVKPEDIQKWVLIGKVKLAFQIKAIKGITQLGESAAACQAALEDTQDLAEELLYAEARLGDMLAKIPQKKKTEQGSGAGTQFSLPDGINKKQSHYAQELSKNEDAIAEVVATAREKGEIPVRSQVLKQVKTAERQTKRDKMSQRGKKIPKDDRWQIKVGDIRTYQTSRKFDFIITDPPYLKEHLNLYAVLAKRANDWLDDGGLLIAMCGQSYLDQIYKAMSEHLQYYWTGCYLTPGQPTPLRQRQVNTTWKPLLFFTKHSDKYKGKIFGDVFTSDANDKSKHKWGQSESGMFSIVSRVCLPGQTVFDPFCGAATTGVAALKHGCLFHGIDSEQKCVDLSKGRLTYDKTEK